MAPVVAVTVTVLVAVVPATAALGGAVWSVLRTQVPVMHEKPHGQHAAPHVTSSSPSSVDMIGLPAAAETFMVWVLQETGLMLLHVDPFGQHIAVVLAARDKHVDVESQQKLPGRPCPHGEKFDMGHVGALLTVWRRGVRSPRMEPRGHDVGGSG